MNRLTARSLKNGMAYLVGVNPEEQDVESPYPNTLRCIMDCFNRLAEYEDTGLLPEDVTRLAEAKLIYEAYDGSKLDKADQYIERLEAETGRLKQWINDLQSGMYVNCVYCGHRYGPAKDTPVSMADVLKEHVEQCPEHPMSKLKAELEQYKEIAKAKAEGRLQIIDKALFCRNARKRNGKCAGYHENMFSHATLRMCAMCDDFDPKADEVDYYEDVGGENED